MDAEQIAREYMDEADGRLAADEPEGELPERDVLILCRAVLDAAEYRKRAEAVANEMNDWCEQSDALGYPADTRGYRLWAQQLLDYSKIGCKI